MAHVTGNATWQDWPNTSTIVSAGALEAIEGQLDRGPDDNGCARYRTSGGQALSGNTAIPLTTAASTTVHVTATSATVFTLNTSGVWMLAGGAAVGTSGTITLSTWIGGTTATATRYATSAPIVGSFPAGNVSTGGIYLPSGTQFTLWAYTSAAVTSSTSYNSGETFLSMTLLRR